jgi:hypothetical protein
MNAINGFALIFGAFAAFYATRILAIELEWLPARGDMKWARYRRIRITEAIKGACFCHAVGTVTAVFATYRAEYISYYTASFLVALGVGYIATKVRI